MNHNKYIITGHIFFHYIKVEYETTAFRSGSRKLFFKLNKQVSEAIADPEFHNVRMK